MSALERVLERLERVRKAGPGWYARCPAHEDRSPSLRVALGDDDRVLLDCKVGCKTSDVITAIGLEWRDLFEDSPPPRQPNAPRRVKRSSESSPPLARQQLEDDHDDGLTSTEVYLRELGDWNLDVSRPRRSRVELGFEDSGEASYYRLRPLPLETR